GEGARRQPLPLHRLPPAPAGDRVGDRRVIAGIGTGDKLRGRAPYVRDLARQGTAVVGIVRSPHPHARVLAVDVSRALRVNGILGGLTGADLPDLLLDSDHPDEHVLVKDRARFVGDHVAALAAEHSDALRAALPLVEVEY